MSVKMRTASISEIGLNPRYQVNEDSFLIMEKERVFAVADGVGGAHAGDIASQTVIEIIRHGAKRSSIIAKSQPIDYLLNLIRASNEALWQLGMKLNKQVASTIALLVVEDGYAMIGNVGDSRAYLIRHGQIMRLSRDHSKLQELLENNPHLSLSRSEYADGHVITRALGVDHNVQAEVQKVLLKDQDIFLLCTDGIYIHNSEEEMLAIVEENRDHLKKICLRLKKNCYDRGAQDNLTAVVVHIVKSGG